MDGLNKITLHVKINDGIVSTTCRNDAQDETESNEADEVNFCPQNTTTLDYYKRYANDIRLSGYYREVLITINDYILNRYTEKYIASTLQGIMNEYSNIKYIAVPDYSPVDGRLHYHMLCTNFKEYRQIAKMKQSLSQFGHIFIKQKDIDSVDYLFKIYESNSKTPNKTQIQPFKYALIDEHNQELDNIPVFVRRNIKEFFPKTFF